MIDKKAYGEIYSRVLADEANTKADLEAATTTYRESAALMNTLTEQLAALRSTLTNLERFADPKDVKLALDAQSELTVIITPKT